MRTPAVAADAPRVAVDRTGANEHGRSSGVSFTFAQQTLKHRIDAPISLRCRTITASSLRVYCQAPISQCPGLGPACQASVNPPRPPAAHLPNGSDERQVGRRFGSHSTPSSAATCRQMPWPIDCESRTLRPSFAVAQKTYSVGRAQRSNKTGYRHERHCQEHDRRGGPAEEAVSRRNGQRSHDPL